MVRTRIVVVLIVSFCLISLPLPAGSSPACASGCSPYSYDFTELTTIVQDGIDTLPLAGASLMLIEDDQAIYERAFGAYTLDTTVLIASASKWLSATTIMTLVDEGLIDLDAPISTYLPNATGTAGTITTRQLLSHTSGMTTHHACLAFRHITLEQCANQILATPLLAPPDAQFFYGENSLQVAGRIAEVVTGQTWNELFNERIGERLEMHDTSYGDGANPLMGSSATTSLGDYGNLMRMHLADGVFEGEVILSPAATQEMRHDQTNSASIAFSPYDSSWRYGLGNWVESTDQSGAPLQNSSQGAFGFTPWIDWTREVAGIFLVHDTATHVQPLVRDIRGAVREAIDAGPVCRQRLYLPLIQK